MLEIKYHIMYIKINSMKDENNSLTQNIDATWSELCNNTDPDIDSTSINCNSISIKADEIMNNKNLESKIYIIKTLILNLAI